MEAGRQVKKSTIRDMRLFWDRDWAKEDHNAYSTWYSWFLEDIRPLGRVLDVGSGDFFAVHQISHLQPLQYIGLDLSREALLRRAKEPGVQTQPVLAAAQALPFKDRAFDTVISFDTLSLCGQEYLVVIEEMCRVSSRNIVFNIMHENYYAKYNSVFEKRSTLTYGFTNEEALEKMLNQNGFSDVRLRVLSENDVENFNRPLWQRSDEPDGEAKCLIFAMAGRQP